MSKIPVSGVCRLPKPTGHLFRPPPVQTPNINFNKSSTQLTAVNIGDLVRVGDKEGILRFIGQVQFADGVWCGIELPEAAGKNNGRVCGIKYFHCAPMHGLMVPLYKCSLVGDKIQGFPAKNSNVPNYFDVSCITPASTTLSKSDQFYHSTPAEEEDLKDQSENLKSQSGDLSSQISQNGDSKTRIEVANPSREFQLNLSSTNDEERDTKRDSLDMEESLGILTPDQMQDSCSIASIGPLRYPNLHSIQVPDEVDNLKDEDTCEETLSPEELPLDPPVINLDPNPVLTESQKKEIKEREDFIQEIVKNIEKKATTSFITSITSITSLDTGYQGDGEMSRPASRGADNSPLTRRPIPRSQQQRRQDPMTDSDFYTESDADNHEENVVKGDRKAQVIDGTLYGVDPQAAADIYVNNRENMDSSGIFTDIEHVDEMPPVNNRSEDVSPSDTSTKTISENSQNNLKQILEKSLNNKVNDKILNEVNEIEQASPTVSNSSSSNISPKHTNNANNNNNKNNKNKSDSAKKLYKMPKREVPSKVKANLESKNAPIIEKKTKKPTVSRWDAVMNKISKNDNKANLNLKEVKSKVFNNLCPPKNGNRVQVNNTKVRRVRSRVNNATSPRVSKNIASSIHSSMSDLSAPAAISKGSNQKKDIPQVTQVLTPNKLSAATVQNNLKNKKSSPPPITKTKRNLQTDKKQIIIKDCGKNAVKASRTTVRPPISQTVQIIQPPPPPPPTTKQLVQAHPKVAEALAVLVQHLVFNVGAYEVPNLRRQIDKYQHLEKTLAEERVQKVQDLEQERLKFAHDLQELSERHQQEIKELNEKHVGVEERLRLESERLCEQLNRQHQEQLLTLKNEFQKLQKTHEDTLEILREENDAIREQIDDKNSEIEVARHESDKLKRDYESRECAYKKQIETLQLENNELSQRINKLEGTLLERVRIVEEENRKLREENDRLLGYGDERDIGVQEVESLRAVLDLKQNEVLELRRSLAEAMQKAELLAAAEERNSLLNAKCEDINLQLERKNEQLQSLIAENKRLQESFKEEINQKRRLSQHNEELQWKLKQNKEVISKVLEQAEETALNRSFASFNEKHSFTNKPTFERTLSFRERSYSNMSGSRKSKSSSADLDEDLSSPPNSPKIKGVVEKSDSVSYVLDLDESPDVLASRIVRRSFRNPTPSKGSQKSPSNSKRPRVPNPLSLSASTSAILTSGSRRRSNSARNGDEEDSRDVFEWVKANSSTPKGQSSSNFDLDDELEDELELPALPSELGRQKDKIATLPSPKRLADDNNLSESNSDDESLTSSSSQL